MRRFRSGPSATVRRDGRSLEVWVASSFRARLLGLAALEAIPRGTGLLIPHCACVHTWGMRFAIDVAFVEWPPAPDGCAVLSVAEAVTACRTARVARPARRTAAIEAAARSLSQCGIETGCYLQLDGG
jgi:uncharacterized membrane protein (UPF0127 family)